MGKAKHHYIQAQSLGINNANLLHSKLSHYPENPIIDSENPIIELQNKNA